MDGSVDKKGPESQASHPKESAPGLSKRCYLVSLGCPKNRVDSEWVKSRCEGAGYGFVDNPGDADIIFINTCGFIQDAAKESVDAVLEAVKLRDESERVSVKVVVMGCLPQRYGRELAESLPEVDLFVGCSRLDDVVSLIQDPPQDPLQISDTPSFLPDGPFVRTPSTGPHSAYVKVSEGCDRVCAFCTVPAIRGPARSRKLKDIVQEVSGLVQHGVTEINVVAQDLTAYGRDLDEGADLITLFRSISVIEGLRWIRPLYLYPSTLTHRFLQSLAAIETVVPYLDIPLQHVAEPVLKSMARGYGARSVDRLMERVRTLWPQAFLRTTFLVGHPGETEEAFQELLDFVKRWRFDHMGVFAFSPEEGTPSAALSRPEREVAQRRRQVVMEAQKEISQKKQRAFVGDVMTVLSDGVTPESAPVAQGRHAGQTPDIDGVVYITEDRREADLAPRLHPGEWLDVEITEAGDYDLVGAVVGPEKKRSN